MYISFYLFIHYYSHFLGKIFWLQTLYVIIKNSFPNTQSLTKLKGKIDSNTITVGDFNTPLSVLDKTTRQKVIKETEELNNIVDQLDLINLYRILHPTADIHSLQVRVNILQNSMLGHKTSFNKLKIKIIQSIFFDHSGMKLEISSTRKTGKSTNMWILNNTLLNNQRVKEEITREFRKYLEAKENKTTYQNLRWGESSKEGIS